MKTASWILRVSSRPGRWKTATTPYLREIMDAFTDPEVEEIVVVKAAQTGGHRRRCST